MENKICNNCGAFLVMSDGNKLKHYQCSLKNMLTRPSNSCGCWYNVEKESEQKESGGSTRTRVWNPRSKRHEDVITE